MPGFARVFTTETEDPMTRITMALGTLLAGAALLAGCSDPAGVAARDERSLGTPSFAAQAGGGMTLDQFNGQTNAAGTVILKGFNPTNPHRGDAIIATFFWVGSSNTITSVGDHLTDGTPVGNTYRLVDY